MPSTFSTSLGIELIGNGEQAGTWGTTTNNNLGTLLEQAIAGVESITLTGNYTLTDFNGISDEARNAVLVFTGSLGAPCNVIAPSVQKTYIVRNVSGATVTVKTALGNGVAIANAASEVIFCDSTNFFSATQFNFIEGNLTVTGTATANNVVATNNITLGRDLFANSSTGQFYLPVGTDVQRTASPVNGVIRYNTTLNVYEGYQNNAWVRFQTFPQGNYTIAYLVVAGGGGGGPGVSPDNVPCGGGGAGGVITGNWTATPGNQTAVVVGAGGSPHVQGSPSSLTDQSSVVIGATIGGGFGGYNFDDFRDTGGNGGSGGGQGRGASGGASPGTGTAGQGNNGGANSGGGAAAVGGSSGGAGLSSAITGTGVFYGGGGGGTVQAGGVGGGGAGGNNFGAPGPTGISGSVNTGGGGGGAGGYTNGAGSGGSGVIILRMPTSSYSGVTTGSPTVTVDGAFTVLRYSSSGTYTT